MDGTKTQNSSEELITKLCTSIIKTIRTKDKFSTNWIRLGPLCEFNQKSK
jgi:hypothetical protein